MILQVGVKILLRNSEGKYLLVKRDPQKYPGIKELWDLPGGRINPGTSLLENLRRELKEEVNMDFEGKPILVAAQDILGVDRHIVRLTYKGEAAGEPKLIADEHTELGWFTVEEILKLEKLDHYLQEVLESN